MNVVATDPRVRLRELRLEVKACDHAALVVAIREFHVAEVVDKSSPAIIDPDEADLLQRIMIDLYSFDLVVVEFLLERCHVSSRRDISCDDRFVLMQLYDLYIQLNLHVVYDASD